MTYDIKSGKKIYKYHIDGIKRGPRYSQSERRQLLLKIIEKNPEIKNTHVIKIAYGLRETAKKTIELELARLEKDGLLRSIKLGRSPNAPRIWNKRILESPIDKKTKADVDSLLYGLDNSIKELEKQYAHLTIEKKAKTLVLLLILINYCQPLFVLGGKIIESDVRKKVLQDLLDRVYSILFSDKDFHQIKSLIVQHVYREADKSNDRYTFEIFDALKKSVYFAMKKKSIKDREKYPQSVPSYDAYKVDPYYW
jgi:hypothetical protein